MKDLLFIPAFAPIAYIAQNSVVNQETLPLWERLLEKWGIGFIGMALFGALAYVTYRKEERDRIKREEREEAVNAERVELAKTNNTLTMQLVTYQITHAAELEKILHANAATGREITLELQRLNDHLKGLK